MSEWTEYTGSDYDIDKMCNAVDGYILRLSDGTETELTVGGPYRDEDPHTYLHKAITHYLICEPHQLADMIIKQAQTGQPVWIKSSYINGIKPYEFLGHSRDTNGGYWLYKTTKPDWNIPNAEYSFTALEE